MSRLLLRRRILATTQPYGHQRLCMPPPGSARQHTNFPTSAPAPPRLAPKEQAEFERLQRDSTGAFSTPATRRAEGDAELQRQTETRMKTEGHAASMRRADGDIIDTTDASTPAHANLEVKRGEEMHPDVRRGPAPEFEGERNPRTGEVGGPKNEPLRWGSDGTRGDWSYAGRVTDF